MSILDAGYNCYIGCVGSLTNYVYNGVYKDKIDNACLDKPTLNRHPISSISSNDIIGSLTQQLNEQQNKNFQKMVCEIGIRAIITYDIGALLYNINVALTIISTVGFLLSSTSIIFPAGLAFSCYLINGATERSVKGVFKEDGYYANFPKTFQVPFFKSLYIPPNPSSPFVEDRNSVR